MSTNRKHPTLGVVLALTSSLLFGLNASTTKVLVQSGITPSQLVLFRSLAVAVIAGLALLVTNRRAFKIGGRELGLFAIYGVLGIALMQWAYSNAVSTMQVGPALLIEYTSVVMVPLASLLIFKERVHNRLWMAVALVLVGLVIVAHPWNSWLNPVGVGWAFMAAVMLSIYFIMGERLQRTRDPLSTLFYSFTASSLFWAVAAAITSTGFVSFDGLVELGGNLGSATLPTWVLLAWMAVAASFAPMLFTVLALRHLSAAGVGIASTAETVFAFVFGYLWLSERIDVAQTVGASIVIVGIVLAQTARSAKWQPSN
ncbi:MAG: DMT family transporter [Micrococcales bacterium]